MTKSKKQSKLNSGKKITVERVDVERIEKGQNRINSYNSSISLFHNNDWRLIIVYIVIGFSIYANSLNNPFIWDDDYLIVRNSQVTGDSSISEIFFSDIMIGSGRRQSSFYRPLQILSFRIDYSLWGDNPFGFHLTSTIIHIVNTILIYFFITTVFKNRKLSLFCSFLFLIHPVQTEAVTYLASRSENVMLLFYMVSLLLYYMYRHTHQLRFLWLSLLGFICSLLSKEMAVSLPLIIVLLDLIWIDAITIEERLLKRYLPYFLIVIFYFYFRTFVLDLQRESITTYGLLPIHYNTSLFIRLLTFCKVLSVYTGLLFFPMKLYMERSLSGGVSLVDPLVATPLVIIVCVMMLSAKINRTVLLGFLWFLVTLLPVSGIIPINYLLAERYLYLPSIGFFIAVGGFRFLLYDRVTGPLKKYIPPIGLVLMILVCGALMVRTVMRNADWSDELLFYQQTLRHSPDSTRVHNNLGTEYGKRQRYHEAIRAFKKAIDLLDDYIDPHNNLGYAYYNIGEYDKAIEEFRKVIELGGQPHSTYQDIINHYIDQDDNTSALHVFLTFGATESQAYNDLAMHYFRQKRIERAIELMKKSLELDKYNAEAHVSLGSMYAEIKEYEKAKYYWEQALAINPGLEAARVCLQRLKQVQDN